MRNIAACSVLSRMSAEFPPGLNVQTEEFAEGWKLMKPGSLERLKKAIRKRGWDYIKIESGPLRSAVGNTSDEAIVNALRLSLRHISEYFNLVEVEGIQLAEYPWFFVAGVLLSTYRIQETAFHTMPDNSAAVPIVRSHTSLFVKSPVMCPRISATTPLLREMLVVSRVTEGKTQ